MCSPSRHNEYEGTTLTERITLATAPSATTEQVSPEQRAVEETLVARVLASFDGTPDPRLRKLMQALVSHLHAFIREVRLTEKEWSTAIAFLTDCGHITDYDKAVDAPKRVLMWVEFGFVALIFRRLCVSVSPGWIGSRRSVFLSRCRHGEQWCFSGAALFAITRLKSMDHICTARAVG
jgi:hypothetical protein